MFFSLVLPAYNEANALPKAVEAARAELLKIKGLRFEIIIAEDGSRDETPEVAKRLSRRFKDVRLLHSDERLGRGRALNRAFRSARGDVVAFMDVDLATAPKHLRELVRYSRDFDVVIGSRYLASSKAERSLSRRFLSWWFNFLVRALLGSRVRDHQCGFKAFRKVALLKILPRVRARHWFWDAEVLVIAQRSGLSVKEFPVEWVEKGRGGKTKVNLKRDVLDMFFGILELRWRLWFG
ncbi:MAG: glycosyltransferase family 2 protein [Candidatus Norongarragalinales archaeon]